MDSLIPAFVAAFFGEFGDKSWWLALALGAAYQGRIAPYIGICLAAIANCVFSAGVGHLIAPLLTINARNMMLAITLILGAATMCLKRGEVQPRKWPLGSVGGAFFGFLLYQVLGNTGFLTFGIAVKSGSFAVTSIGASAGVMVAAAIAYWVGPEVAKNLPVRGLRYGIGGVMLLIGLPLFASALRLI